MVLFTNHVSVNACELWAGPTINNFALFKYIGKTSDEISRHLDFILEYVLPMYDIKELPAPFLIVL